jgi:integrative and conjugative element protein (TIGR02256 family)
MIFLRPSGGQILVARAALATIKQFRQIGGADLEAGGILLGRILLDSDDIVIDEAVAPSLRDDRRRYFFRRRRREAQARVVSAWTESAGASRYLGEWHTHPEQIPTPSSHDLSEWCRIAREARYEQKSLLFFIQGIMTLKGWEVDRLKQSIVTLAAIQGVSRR